MNKILFKEVGLFSEVPSSLRVYVQSFFVSLISDTQGNWGARDAREYIWRF